MIKSSILLLTSLFLLTSCSPFGDNKNVNNSISNGLTPKELYKLSELKLNAGSVDQALEQLKIIIAAYPGSKYAIQARLDISYNLLKQKKYNLALAQVDKFIEKYPALNSTPYAYYLRGAIEEDRSSSILDNIVTDSAQRDVQSVKDAYSYYILLIDRFPSSKYSDEAKTKLTKLKDTLARHEFYVGLYYTNNQAYIASINRCKYIIENYPNSPSIPDALSLMSYNYDEINASTLADDLRLILKSNFPSYSPSYSLN